LAPPRRNWESAAREIAQILIVERWCLEERNQLAMRLRIVGKDIEHHCALVAQQKFDRPVLCRLEPRGMSENRAKRGVLGRRQGFEHRPLLERSEEHTSELQSRVD